MRIFINSLKLLWKKQIKPNFSKALVLSNSCTINQKYPRLIIQSYIFFKLILKILSHFTLNTIDKKPKVTKIFSKKTFEVELYK